MPKKNKKNDNKINIYMKLIEFNPILLFHVWYFMDVVTSINAFRTLCLNSDSMCGHDRGFFVVESVWSPWQFKYYNFYIII